jgi:hypothetical protein
MVFAQLQFSFTFAVLKRKGTPGRWSCSLKGAYRGIVVVGSEKWELSSAGSEHLPYKQRVGGSNPSAPTKSLRYLRLFYFPLNSLY